MKKIISFSLYGSNPIYTSGLQYNIELAKTIYPDWVCRVYLYQECFHLENILLQHDNVELVKIDEVGSSIATMKRFLPIGEQDVAYFICRDADSRLSLREKQAVDEWLVSGKNFHIMKDHPYHYCDEYPILAGMWGAKGNLIPEIEQLINSFKLTQENKKGIDQKLLYYIYHNFAKNSFFEHGLNTFPGNRNYKNDNIFWVGQPFDEKNNFYGDWKNDIGALFEYYEKSFIS